MAVSRGSAEALYTHAGLIDLLLADNHHWGGFHYFAMWLPYFHACEEWSRTSTTEAAYSCAKVHSLPENKTIHGEETPPK